MKRRNKDSLIPIIEQALARGRFISYGQSFEFVSRLEEVKNAIDAAVRSGGAERGVGLYELFLAGCYEKADEIDDSGGSLGMFFQELFISWIKARQRAGRDGAETVRQILAWMKNDNYGLCHEIEKSVAAALEARGARLLREHFEQEFERAFAPYRDQEPKRIYDYPSAVYMVAALLKNIYVARKDVGAYVAFCGKTLPSPRDCGNLATLYLVRGRPADALAWVEKGLALERDDRWGNESAYGLRTMRERLLGKLGRADEALASAWSEFQQHPSAYAYENVMRYVPRKDQGHWHDQAMQEAGRASLGAFIDVCNSTKQWGTLAKRLLVVADEEIEQISHVVTEKAASGLARKNGLAAAKVYRALGMRILKSAKSKYYRYALDHFRAAKRLYEKHGQEQSWQAIVERVRKEHARKSGFIHEFERLVTGGRREPDESFETTAGARWRRQVSR